MNLDRLIPPSTGWKPPSHRPVNFKCYLCGWIGLVDIHKPACPVCTHKEENRLRAVEASWDRFIEHYARENGFIDKDGKLTMINFIGSIKHYKKAFLEANRLPPSFTK